MHAALTGAPFSGADAIELGFADHFVPQADLEPFTAMVAAEGPEVAVDAFAQDPPPSPLAGQRHWIDECYAGQTIAEIMAALRGHHDPAAGDAASLIATRSPVALAVTLAAVRRAAALKTLEDVLVQEYRVSCASLRSHDFVEGIRAQLVDKDRNPQWSPSSIDAVTEADVEAYFAPADPDLTF
jgi:enoyl-CoA hydratase